MIILIAIKKKSIYTSEYVFKEHPLLITCIVSKCSTSIPIKTQSSSLRSSFDNQIFVGKILQHNKELDIWPLYLVGIKRSTYPNVRGIFKNIKTKYAAMNLLVNNSLLLVLICLRMVKICSEQFSGGITSFML